VSMEKSSRFLDGLKTYIFSSVCVLLMFATIWWGPLSGNSEFAKIVMSSIVSIVFLVGGKSVASKVADVVGGKGKKE